MSDEQAQARKRALRAEARRLPRVRGERDAERALARLLALDELVDAGTVSLYAATGTEVPVSAALAAFVPAGKRSAFPRVVDSEIALFEVTDVSSLRPGYRGIPEPSAREPRVEPREVDAFVVPGVYFDRQGRRLGRGGGHYDRLLALAREDAVRIGICYADQLVEELPAADWDVQMSVVVSDREVIRPSVGSRQRER